MGGAPSHIAAVPATIRKWWSRLIACKEVSFSLLAFFLCIISLRTMLGLGWGEGENLKILNCKLCKLV